jgi:hypothetical protein
MAAGTWKMFTSAKKSIGNASLSTANGLSGAFRMALFTSASNLKTAASAKPLVHLSSVTGELASAFGYTLSGRTMPAEVWGTVSNTSMRFTFCASGIKWSATGTIANIKYAAIFASGASAGACHLLSYVTLTTTGFALADTNTLTVKPAAGGIFKLSGM